MRETNSNGHEVIFMPREATETINRLAKLGAVAAKRDWERAAYVALHVKPAGRGRPSKTGKDSSYQQDNTAEFIRRGIYGLTSGHAIKAWLKAWESSGLPVPQAGDRVELPLTDFPELGQFYPGKSGDNPAGELGGSEDTDPEDDTEDAAEGQDEPSPPRPGPNPRPRPEVTMLDKLLTALDSMEPSLVLHGQPTERRALLIKTLESWLDSLREAEAVEEGDNE